MKVLDKTFVLSWMLAGASILGAEYLHIHWMYNLAGISLGMVAMIGALKILITGQARGAAAGMSRWYRESKHTERYSGAPARMIGVVILLAGSIAITLSVVDLTTPGGIDAFWDEFLRSPRAWALVLGVAGFIVTTLGIVRAKVGSAAAPGAYNAIVEAEFRVGGVFAVVAGVAMLLVAAILIIAPGMLQGILGGLWKADVRHQ